MATCVCVCVYVSVCVCVCVPYSCAALPVSFLSLCSNTQEEFLLCSPKRAFSEVLGSDSHAVSNHE